MVIEKWFPTLIMFSKLNISPPMLKSMIDRVYEIRNNNKIKHEWNCDIYSSLGVDLSKDEVISPLVDAVTPLVKEFSKSFSVSSNKLKCVNYWVNISAPGDFQEYHIHPNSHFSVVTYLKTAPGCGDIVFKSFSADSDMFQLPVQDENDNNFSFCRYTPEDLKTLIFRSNVKHMVKRNNSGKDRISVSFNFEFLH